jgi:hypothetical protein
VIDETPDIEREAESKRLHWENRLQRIKDADAEEQSRQKRIARHKKIRKNPVVIVVSAGVLIAVGWLGVDSYVTASEAIQAEQKAAAEVAAAGTEFKAAAATCGTPTGTTTFREQSVIVEKTGILAPGSCFATELMKRGLIEPDAFETLTMDVLSVAKDESGGGGRCNDCGGLGGYDGPAFRGFAFNSNLVSISYEAGVFKMMGEKVKGYELVRVKYRLRVDSDSSN